MLVCPLDMIEYDASALGGLSPTLTRGVLCSETDYITTPAGGLNVSLSDGWAWLKKEKRWGVFALEEKATTLTVSLPDGNLSRLDAVCIRLNKNENKGEILIKRGTPSTNPILPKLIQDGLDFDEIYVSSIRVRAGTTSINAGDITDLRLDENYCGLVRDGITKIPTQTLINDWRSWFNNSTVEFSGELSEWFETIKGTLDEDAATNLFNLIEKKLDKTGGTISGNLNVTGSLQKSGANVITTSGGTITGATNFTGALQKSSANVTTVNDFKGMSMSNIKFGWRRINDDFISGGTVVPTQLLAQYSKVGNMVFFSIDATIPITSNESAAWQAVIFDLPFTASQICSITLGRSANCFIDAGGAVVYNPTAIVADKKIYFYDQTGANQIRWRPTAPKYLNLSGFAYI